MKSEISNYILLLVRNTPFAIAPFVGMLYFIVAVPAISEVSIVDGSAYSFYVAVSTMVIFSFSAMPPAIMKYNKIGVSFFSLKKIIIIWSLTLSIITSLGLTFIGFILNDEVISLSAIYFYYMIPEVVFSVLCGFCSASLVLSGKGNEIFKVAIIVLALKVSTFLILLNYSFDLFYVVILPNVIFAVFYYILLVVKIEKEIIFNNSSVYFKSSDFLKKIHVDSLDAIVVSLTFMLVAFMAGKVSDSALVFSTIIMTTIRLVILPMKRIGLAYGFELKKLKKEEVKVFIIKTVQVKYIALIFILPLIYVFFIFTNYNIGLLDANFIFMIILAQLLVEPIASYLTSVSKFIGFGYQNLRYTIIYQWCFCLPIIYGLYLVEMLTLESLWGVMVIGRLVFAALFGLLLHKNLALD